LDFTTENTLASELVPFLSKDNFKKKFKHKIGSFPPLLITVLSFLNLGRFEEVPGLYTYGLSIYCYPE
jgi:hypothetical protein